MTPIGVGREDFGFILKCGGTAVGFILHRTEHTETAKFFSPGGALLPPNTDRKSRRNRFFLHHLAISPSGKHAGLVQACRHNVYKSMNRESINLSLHPVLCLCTSLVLRLSSQHFLFLCWWHIATGQVVATASNFRIIVSSTLFYSKPVWLSIFRRKQKEKVWIMYQSFF